MNPADTVDEPVAYRYRVTGRGVGKNEFGVAVNFWYVVTVNYNGKSYVLEECFIDGKKYYPATLIVVEPAEGPARVVR